MIVNLFEIPQPIREALPAPLTEARHDVLYEAVSFFLLVRRQLQRIKQMSTKSLRYCIRFKDLGLVNTPPKACLVASSRICLHRLRTTSCYVRFLQKPTKRGLPTGNCYNAGTTCMTS